MPDRRSVPWVRLVGFGALAVIVVLVTFVANNLWVTVATTVGIMAIGAMGLSLMYSTGLLSLGQAFFMAVGGYSYVILSADGTDGYIGLGLEPVLALVLAVVISGVAGLLFSPISSRIGGIELAVATLGLVYLGQHIAKNSEALTGGSRGRSVDYFSIAGFELDTIDSSWLLVLVCLVAAAFVARNLARGKHGLAMNAIRDGALFAGAMGVPVARTKAQVFLVSSMYAGLAGALLAITSGAIVPEAFGLTLSLNLLIMVVLGGSSSVVAGSVVGAAVVMALPELLRENADLFPFVAANPLEPGLAPGEVAQYLYGAAVILVLVFSPGGIVEIVGKVSGRVRSRLARKSVPPATPEVSVGDIPTREEIH